MKKCIYTIAIDNWFPEICSITLPLIQNYANRIKADFRVISKSSHSNWPPNYEKFQIWESGKDYDWNIYVDADMIINPYKIPDFTEQDPKTFYFESQLRDIKSLFKFHPYFIKDGRNFGVSDCFLVTSSLTHNLWHPSSLKFEEAEEYCLINKRMISEFIISLNIAQFDLKGKSIIGQDKNHFHLQTTDDYNRTFNGGPAKMTKEEHIIRALNIAKMMIQK
jgi:hypothetical protein